MNAWHDIDPRFIGTDSFLACIEISKGSQCKYELDKKTGMLILDRVLSTSTQYPANYGFIPLTYASDGDPLDVLVLCQEPIVPLTLVRCIPLGVIIMVDNGDLDEKIIAIAEKDPMWNTYNDLNQLPPHYVREVSNFFEVYKMLENKITSVEGIENCDGAKKIIKECLQRYQDKILPTLK